MNLQPLIFEPIYKEKIWGGRNLERLFGRALPPRSPIGESWELADLPEGVSTVATGPARGRFLTDLLADWGEDLLGPAKPTDDGRFPLLLKLLDANDTLSLQVHPDAQAVADIRAEGERADLKTECWYVVESRGGAIYKGVQPGITPERFREAIETDTAADVTRRIDCRTDDFHFLPAGTVHALGAGLVVAEVQTPSDTTYRVTDWGRGREIHVERSMQCIHFTPADDVPPGRAGQRLLQTVFFDVYLRETSPGEHAVSGGRCVAWIILDGRGVLRGEGFEPVEFLPGQTLLLPAGLGEITLGVSQPCKRLEIMLPPGS
jgi:mannose-6-phosphate isomerase